MKNKIIGCFISFLLIGIIFSYNITDIFADNVSVIKYYKCNNGGTLSGNKCIKDISISTYCKKGERHYGSCYDVIRKEYEKTTPTYTCPEGKLIKNSTEPGNIDGYICEYEKEKLTKCPDGYGQTSATTCIRTYQYNATYNGVDCGDSENIPYTNLCKKEVNATPNYTCKTSYFKKKDNYTCMNAYNVKVNSDYICPSNTTQVGSSASCIKTVASYNAKKVGKKYKCNSNDYKLKGSKCIKTKVIRGTLKETYSCPHGGERQGNVCVQTESTIVNYTCNNGKLKGNKCILTSKGRTKWKCTRSDSVLVGDKCNVTVTKDLLPTCKDGFKAKAGDSSKCVRYFSPKKIVQETTNTSNKTTFSKKIEIPCPSDYTPVNNAEQVTEFGMYAKCFKKLDLFIVDDKCPDGYGRIDHDTCRYSYDAAISSIRCSDKNYEYSYVSKKCVKKNDNSNSSTSTDNSNTTNNNQSNQSNSQSSNSSSTTNNSSSSSTANSNTSSSNNNSNTNNQQFNNIIKTHTLRNLRATPNKITFIYANQSQAITVTGLSTDQSVTFTSENPQIANVDQNGVVTPVGVGKTNILVKRNIQTDKTDEVTIVVEVASLNVRVTDINISSENTFIKVNETTKVLATLLPENATNKGINYTSSNTAIATVDQNGVVTGRSAGEVTIYAISRENVNIKSGTKITIENAEQTPTISNGNKTEPDKIEQTENSVIKRYIVVDKNYNTLNVGDKKKISAKYYVVKTVNNKSNTTLNNENLEYLSSNENILSVDARGVITALSEGEATITVRAKDNNDIVETVTYKVLPSSNVINLVKLEETVYDIAKGDSKYIKIIDDNVENYTFISANKKVATVDDLGEIKGISRGNTTIDIINKNNNNIRSNILVNVSETNSFNSFEDKNNIISIDLNIKRVNIVKGKTFNLNANATDGSKLKYKSSNSRVATVSSDGKIKGTSKGNAIITISLENNPSIKEDVVVNVVNKEKELNDFEKYNAEKLGLKTNSITIEEEDNYVIKTKDIKDIKYYSTNQNVASVSSDGVITAQKQGTCKVYITSSDTSDYITVKVNKKTVPEKVIIAQKSLDLTVGKTEKLDVEVLPKNAKNKDVIYSSTNSNIVSISDDGVVTAMQVGTAYVQAMSLEDNAVKAYIKVTVK